MIIVVGILYRLGMEHYLPWAEQRSWVYLWLRNVIKEVNLEEKLPNRGQFSFLRDMTTLKQELPWGGIHRSDARLWMTRYASEDPPSPQSHRPHDAPRLPGRHLTPPTAAGSCSSPASGLPPGDGPSEIHRAWAPWSSHHRTYPQRPSHKALTGLRVRQSGPSWEGPGSWSLTRAAGATGNLISPSFESILTQGTTKKAQRRPGLLREAPTLNLWRRWPSGEPTFQLTSGTPGCRLPGAVTVTPSGGREAGPPFSKEEPFWLPVQRLYHPRCNLGPSEEPKAESTEPGLENVHKLRDWCLFWGENFPIGALGRKLPRCSTRCLGNDGYVTL